jgi:hypothetical protein
VKLQALLAALSLVSASAPALAQDAKRPDSVRLILPSCSELPFDGRDLTDKLDIELKSIGIQRIETPGPNAAEPLASVTVDVQPCDFTAPQIELSLTDQRSAVATRRTMPIADLATSLRSRAIAIGIVELIHASYSDAPPAAPPPAAATAATAVSSPAPAPAPVPVPVSVRPVSAAPADRGSGAEEQAADTSGPRVEGGAGAWFFPKHKSALIGPTAAFALAFDRFQGSLGAHVAFGETEISTGSVDMGWASGFLGFGLSSQGALRALVEPRLYLGYAWASGAPIDEGRVSGSTGGRFVSTAVLAGGLRGPVSGAWELFFDLELGHVLSGVTFLSDQERAAGLSAIVLGTRAGIAMRP